MALRHEWKEEWRWVHIIMIVSSDVKERAKIMDGLSRIRVFATDKVVNTQNRHNYALFYVFYRKFNK